jgi:8-oxo-dGTP pyrophosphatase MutT (NUDIX family)
VISIDPFSRFVIDLETALARPLPSASAHAFLEPRPRRSWPPGLDGSHARLAAGLLLVFPIAERAHVLLTVRAASLDRHSGQVSLPGGGVEAGETFDCAALREAREEVGLSVHDVRILGALTPLDIPVSGFRLHPIVGVIGHHPVWTPAHGEVARILEVPVDHLMTPSCLAPFERERDGQLVTVPSFSIGRDRVWGATAMVLAEFLALLGWSPA